MNSEKRPHVSQREFARLEGCDEKQVRRGVASGKLVAGEDGKLDPAQAGSGWRKPRVDSKPAPADNGADSAKVVRLPPGEAGQGGAPDLSGTGTRLKEAVVRKEDFTGRLRELEFLKADGQLVEMTTARRVLFDEARASRDAWLNFPAKFAALIAADLDVEADKVSEVLTGYVHKQLAAIAEPDGHFEG